MTLSSLGGEVFLLAMVSQRRRGDIWYLDRPSLVPLTTVSIPKKFKFYQNYPSPFNASTQIEFTLPSTQRVSFRLYDVLGREVAVLVNEIKTAGEHRVTLDAAGLASGVYLCRIEAGEMMQTRKLVLMK